MRLRNVCFTHFINEEDEFQPTFTEWDEEDDLPEFVRAIVYQTETCPDTGRSHFQGYIEFTKGMRFGGVKKVLGSETVHLEPRQGTAEEAVKYCEKEESRDPNGRSKSIGVFGGSQGSRSDLAIFAEGLLAGKRPSELANEYPVTFIRSHRGIERFYFMQQTKRAKEWRPIRCTVLWGASGTGKTRAAIAMGGDDYFVIGRPTKSGQWWDGYDGEEFVVGDEWRRDMGLSHAAVLGLLDGHELRLPTKGGHCWALWRYVVITSRFHPDTWFEQDWQNDIELRRRIHVIIEYHTDGTTTSEDIDTSEWTIES